MTRTIGIALSFLMAFMSTGCSSLHQTAETIDTSDKNIAVVFDAANTLNIKKVGVSQIAYQSRTKNISTWDLNARLDAYTLDTLKTSHRFKAVDPMDHFQPKSVFQKAFVLNHHTDYILVIKPASKIDTQFDTLSPLKGIGLTDISKLGGKSELIGQVVLQATLYDARSGEEMLNKVATDRWLPQFKLNNTLTFNQQEIDAIYSNTIPVGKSVVHQLLRQLQLIP